MGFLKPVDTGKREGVQLEKPRFIVISEGDMASLEETLSELKNSGREFNALVAVLPLYEGMNRAERKRNRKIKDADGKETGEIETYLSSMQYADNSKQLLPFEITDGNELYASLKFFETPAGSEESSSGEPDDENETV